MLTLLLVIALLFIIVLSLCHMASLSDDEAEEIFLKYLNDKNNPECDNNEQNLLNNKAKGE